MASFNGIMFTPSFVKFGPLIQNAKEKNFDTDAHTELGGIRNLLFSSSWKKSVLKIGFKYFALKKKQKNLFNTYKPKNDS